MSSDDTRPIIPGREGKILGVLMEHLVDHLLADHRPHGPACDCSWCSLHDALLHESGARGHDDFCQQRAIQILEEIDHGERHQDDVWDAIEALKQIKVGGTE